MPDHRRLLRDHRGNAAVEFALIVALFLTLVFGIVEVSIALFEWENAEKATQLGARLAVVSAPAVALPAGNAKASAANFNGEPCRLGACQDFGTLTCANCGSATFDYIFARMQEVYPRLQPGDVSIEYSYAGLGFVGGPTVPAVTVRVNRPFDFIVLDSLLDLLAGGTSGFPSQIMNVKSATLTGEDLRTVNS